MKFYRQALIVAVACAATFAYAADRGGAAITGVADARDRNAASVASALGGFNTTGWSFGDTVTIQNVTNGSMGQYGYASPGNWALVSGTPPGGGGNQGCGSSGERPCPQQD